MEVKLCFAISSFQYIFFISISGTPGEELSKEEKNLAIMAMKKKDRRLYDRIMHSKKKKRSEVKYSATFVAF